MISENLALTEKKISSIPARVGRRKVNFDKMPGRFPAGTFARIDAALAEKETRTDFLKLAVEKELQLREQGAASDSPAISASPQARPARPKNS